MISIPTIIIMLIGTAYTAFLLFLLFTGEKYSKMFEILDEKEFKYHELYCIGGKLMEMSKYAYNSKEDRKIRQNLAVLYPLKYREYYLRAVYAQRATMAAIILYFAFPLYAFTQNIFYFVLVIGLAAFTFYYYGTLPKERIEKRNEEIINDFCEVVSKLALLTNAGAILKDAWEQVCFSGKGLIYDEMKLALDDMNNGMSDADALFKFGTRCMVPEVKKFTATVIQGLSKGNKELSATLSQQSSELWVLKQQLIKRAAEKANSKLLIPMCVMFIGVLIMVIMPIFSNIGGGI